MEGGNKIMDKAISTILGLVAIIFLAVLAYVGLMGLTTFKTMVKNEAEYQCATSSKYEVEDHGATVSYPVTGLYEKCLKDKGIK
ncbi:MAG TPA: hypothetical protein VG917_01190 [Patescibacteria group bacterium]|nr:hypothetical protein [Patescibacteria group bacterium]